MDRRTSGQQQVNTTGLAALDEVTATRLGLMPAALAVTLDSGAAFELPDVLRRSQGLGGGSIEEPPDISAFIHDVVESVRQRYGDALAEPVEEELDKLTDPDVTAAMLDLFFDELRQPVAAAQYLSIPLPGLTFGLPVLPGQRTVTVTIKARYVRDEYQGLVPTKHYLLHNDAAGDVAASTGHGTTPRPGNRPFVVHGLPT